MCIADFNREMQNRCYLPSSLCFFRFTEYLPGPFCQPVHYALYFRKINGFAFVCYIIFCRCFQSSVFLNSFILIAAARKLFFKIWRNVKRRILAKSIALYKSNLVYAALHILYRIKKCLALGNTKKDSLFQTKCALNTLRLGHNLVGH